MASVSSLDKDLRNMRMDKYTPARANETRKWIEDSLGERLPPGDLLEALKDGTALCKLVNLVAPGTVRFKSSAMPFVQMENISHFLRACQESPFSMPAHDCFLTVDLYESKDPAQVLQCIEAFSRIASGIAPSKIPKAIGGLKSIMSPQGTGGSSGLGHARGQSNASDFSNPVSGRVSPVKSGRISPVKSGGLISPSSAGDAGPAWNYAQYGWTGGASQGNQGISFGARRQITSAAPHVPTLAEKERRRKEKAEEEERHRRDAEMMERQRRAEREAEEERAREEEEARWAAETQKLKEQERRAAEAERKKWEEEERRWKQEETKRAQEEKDLESRLGNERLRKSPIPPEKPLRGQMLSQYRAEQKPTSESDRIRDLERQLEEAKERERQYERERQSQAPAQATEDSFGPGTTSVEATPERDLEEDSIQESEPSILKQAWAATEALQTQSPRPLPVPQKGPALGSSPAQVPAATAPLATLAASKRPLPTPQKAPAPSSASPSPVPAPLSTGTSPRPLPNPAHYASSANNTPSQSRTERYLASNPAPQQTTASAYVPSEAAFSSSAEADQEIERRRNAQTKTKAGGWASSSLLEREMERERQRQREWEEGQKQTQEAVQAGRVDSSAGSAPGQTWDVHQYGYTGGDNLNKSTSGVYGGRRQILGPRPMGGKPGGQGAG